MTAQTANKDDLFRLLVDRVRDYAIFGLDPSGIVVSWNTGAQRIKGYAAHEIIGHHFSRFYPEEAVRSGWPMQELENAKRLGSFEDEGWRLRKDGTRFWANVVITALHDDDGVLRGFAKVTRDLTDRMRMQRLEADARTMGEFVAMLAHELRNPLAPIRAAIAVARHPQAEAQRLDWALSVIDRQSSHLSRLVDDLLDVSRITRGRVRLERRRVRLSEALDLALDATRDACKDKDHVLQVHHLADPVVRGDLVRLTQIVTNLIANACKYTPPGGRIDVTLEQTPAANARLCVRDSGIGIPEDLLPRVFDLFTQDHRALDRSEGGLGLGLSISRRLAEMHRGTLVAQSAGRGCGSNFVLEIPAFGADEAGDADRLNVLVVDDNRDAAYTLQSLLELHGHHATVAFDGETAFDAARRGRPDVALLDIGLPGMNGYELARRLRGLPELEGIVLAAVTGYASAEDREQALESGFDAHFAKPVQFDELVKALPILTA